uniref:Uncharacterized protein n=1 Tax=Candidatus Kentrum sp. TC TaxID=2126339 RepID=A0A450YJ64_9GAMM|nr:MAG: hypothetical protein BECKTC1821E_GA0114239_101217 [Candidatus Kentron sp. TC]
MSEFISGFIETISGYLIGRFQASGRVATHISATIISFLCGLIFFISYGIHGLLFPAQNGKDLLPGLLVFSLGVSLCVYFLIRIDIWLKKKKRTSDAL